MIFLENVLLQKYTTLKVGGPAKFLVEITSRREISEAIAWAKEKNLEWKLVAFGSNLLVSDSGYEGLIIVNKNTGIKITGTTVEAESGTELLKLVETAIENNLAGCECLTDIPGSIGGAVYGNAGAYGQTISDSLTWVETTVKRYPKSECGFGYRTSNFKQSGEIILAAGFEFQPGDKQQLQDKFAEIRAKRAEKYPKDMSCPGSFFMNVFFDSLPEEVKKQIPAEKIRSGKIAAGYFLEQVGAKDRRVGGAAVADYHGNLIYNAGGATAADVWTLATQLQQEVQSKFGIKLIPEVQLVGKI